MGGGGGSETLDPIFSAFVFDPVAATISRDPRYLGSQEDVDGSCESCLGKLSVDLSNLGS